MADEFLDLDPEELRDLVRLYGTRLDWYKATLCPCRGNQSVANESVRSESCPFGCIEGWLYRKQTIPAGIADSLGVIRDYNKTVYHPEFGRVPSGEAKWVSIVDECELSDHDIVVYLTASEQTKQLVKRRSGSDFDELAHPCIEAVMDVARGFDSWSEGEHFELVFDDSGPFQRARLRWLDALEAPPVNEFYNVTYTRYPRLIWLDDANQPARRNHAGQRLVQRGALSILSLSKKNR